MTSCSSNISSSTQYCTVPEQCCRRPLNILLQVVPACYRRHFPKHLKSHRSHDIVLLCIDCHQTAHKEAQHVKQQLSQEYNVPLMPPAVPSGEWCCTTTLLARGCTVQLPGQHVSCCVAQ